MSSNVQAGLSIGIIILFFIVISVGYVYVDEARKNIITMNSTLTKFIDAWNNKQAVDNIRFNQTLKGLANTYQLITNTENSIIGNLSNHRVISNITRDQQIDLLQEILNRTH